MHYDAARLTLYIFDEAEAYRKGNEETARILREEKASSPLTCSPRTAPNQRA